MLLLRKRQDDDEDEGGYESLEDLPPPPTSSGTEMSGYSNVTRAKMRTIQGQLKTLDFDPGVIDGKWKLGGSTYTAVKGFQQAYDLTADGKPGRLTQEKLAEAANAPAPEPEPELEPEPEQLYELALHQSVPDASEGAIVGDGGGPPCAVVKGMIAGAFELETCDPDWLPESSPYLVQNTNPAIVFKDEEGHGGDRYMTRRMAAGLDALAVLVANEWPGVKLRVTEAWDREAEHRHDSTHYEGRGADITTSDKDQSKYGRLGGLAVATGKLDWVWYEDAYHIHVAVRPDW